MQADSLLFAIPKKGRLHEKIVSILNESGFEYNRPERQDIAHCKNVPVSLVFLPAADIATFVAKGDVDLGITGEDMVAESDANVTVEIKLGLGCCRLAVQAPANKQITMESLAGKRIATSFPNLTRRFFAPYETATPTEIRRISGSVEVACALGLADGIVDLVETGATMRVAGLEEIAKVIGL